MKYYLDDAYKLCGWENRPFVIYNENDYKSFSVEKEIFLFLFSCNGKKDIDLSTKNEKIQKFVNKLIEQNILHKAKNDETRTLYYYKYPGFYKEIVQWSITGKCNYNCRHCFQSAPEGTLGEPTHEQILDIIKHFKLNGIHNVGLTGGEPLIRSDFFEIVDELIKNKINISVIYSNGALITKEWLKKFDERNIHPTFQISFDGIGFHDWMRGIVGAEMHTREAIRLLASHNYTVICAMCLCKENINSIRENCKCHCTRWLQKHQTSEYYGTGQLASSKKSSSRNR